MKKTFKSILLALSGVFAFTCCEDVPAPYEIPGKEETVPDKEVLPAGDGTLANPFNVAGVLDYISKLQADTESEQAVYVKGKVLSNTTSEATISQYGNMTFTMVDEGNNTKTFTAYQVYGPGNKKFTAVSQIKQGDEVLVYGKVVNYKGNTPETVGKGQAYVYSIQGNSEGGGETEVTEVTCAQAAELANALADGATSTETYTVTGYITEVVGDVSRNQQTFWMADTKDGGRVFEAYWADLPDGVSKFVEGSKVKITGQLMKYVNSSTGAVTPEIKNAKVEIIEAGNDGQGEEPGGEQGGDTSEYGISLSYTGGTNFYEQVATINGVADCPVLKIGTSKAAGDFTLSVPAGKHSFYAVTWKGTDTADVVLKNGEETIKTVTVQPNDGASNNSPYTLTVSDADKYEFEVSAACTLTVTSDKRIIFFGIK